MRVQDSLAQGVSYFMAELHGLKAVVDLADRCKTARAPMLYLLDEILQGTNTAERQIAARHIIRRLVDMGAIGAVSTHDLALAAAPELADAAVTVHFTESFTRGPEGPAMHFDYTLRQGVATSTNALKLMEIVGLT
jgi:DNA mismatch repair ATPase MutS